MPSIADNSLRRLLSEDASDDDDDCKIFDVILVAPPQPSPLDSDGKLIKKENEEVPRSLRRHTEAPTSVAGPPQTPTKAMRSLKLSQGDDRGGDAEDKELSQKLKKLVKMEPSGLGGGKYVGAYALDDAQMTSEPSSSPSVGAGGSGRRKGDGEHGGSPKKKVKEENGAAAGNQGSGSSRGKTAEEVAQDQRGAALLADALQGQQGLLAETRRKKAELLTRIAQLDQEIMQLPDVKEKEKEKVRKREEKAMRNLEIRFESKEDELLEELKQNEAALKICGNQLRFIQMGGSRLSTKGNTAQQDPTDDSGGGGITTAPLPTSESNNVIDLADDDDDDGEEDESTWRCVPKAEPTPSEPPVTPHRRPGAAAGSGRTRSANRMVDDDENENESDEDRSMVNHSDDHDYGNE